MRAGIRLFAVLLMLGLFGGVQSARAQGEPANMADNEYGVGLYLGNCESLVEGAALYDLSDAELETENFEGADENATATADEGTDLEGELEEESSGDETDVEAAIEGTSESGQGSDEEVVVQDDTFLVWVASSSTFGANLVDLIDAPFAVGIRMSADDSADTEGEDGASFVACGEFGGAVAGNEIVIPLRAIEDSGFSGVAILERGESEGESNASIYLFREATDEERSGDDAAEATPTA